MKTNIILKQIQLKNFKKFTDLTVSFDKQTTEISGRNGAGKSTIFDAFTWCLFGKDKDDKTDTGSGAFELKTKVNGKVIEKVEHEVTVLLEINGTNKTFRRCLVENWQQPRGEAEPVLKGNTTHYYINGDEKKESVYKTEIQAFIDERLFKLITNPMFFAGLNWQTRREILLNIIGNISLETVAATSSDLLEAFKELNGDNYDDFKDNIARKIGRINEEMAKIQPEIDGINSVMPEALNWDELEKEKADVDNQIADIDAKLGNIADANRQRYAAIQEKQQKINGLKLQQQQIVLNAQTAEKQRVYDLNETRRNAEMSHKAAADKISTLETGHSNDMTRFNGLISEQNDIITEAQNRRQKLLDDWNNANAKEYQGGGNNLYCPLYNVLCSDASVLKTDKETKDKARAAFYENKNAELDRIEKEGQTCNKTIEEANAKIKRIKDTIEAQNKDYNTQINQLTAEKNRLFNLMNSVEVYTEKAIVPLSIPEYANINGQIEKLEKEIKEEQANTAGGDNTELTANKAELTQKRDGINEKLNRRAQIANCNAKIDKQKAREKELAQQKADLQKSEYRVDELNRKYINEVESRINKLFTYVQFRMFETRINGSETPCCSILVNGINFNGSLNDGARLNAGLDIIKVLSDYYNISAPIFIDGAEKITDWYVDNDCQKILLTAKKDIDLTIN